MWTDWTMWLKYDLNQSSAFWTTATSCDSLCNITLWSTVSNAADKSRCNIMTMFWLSIARRMSLCTQTRAVLTLWLGLYADWLGSQRLYSDMWADSLAATTRSIVLDKYGRLDTGNCSRCPYLDVASWLLALHVLPSNEKALRLFLKTC